MDTKAADSVANRFSLLFYLAHRELARRYAGSLLGPTWALVFPALQIALYCAVFRYGLRIRTAGAVSFGPLLIAGIVPWFALVEALTTMTASLKTNVSLVKRTALPAELLPLSNLAAAICVHGAALVLAVTALWALGFAPGLHDLLLLYAVACLALFALTLGSLLVLANVVFSDVSQAVSAVLLLWFWATPILWRADMLPAGWRSIASVNPLTHLVEAYRYALLGPTAGGFDRVAALSFWCFISLLAVAAWLALRRFKREVADLL